MNNDLRSPEAIVGSLKSQAAGDAIRVTVHAHQEMVEEGISLNDVKAAILDGKVIENYPEHRRGPCCLVCGRDERQRYIHIVCTTGLERMIIITAYEPTLPKWVTPTQRGERT